MAATERVADEAGAFEAATVSGRESVASHRPTAASNSDANGLIRGTPVQNAQPRYTVEELENGGLDRKQGFGIGLFRDKGSGHWGISCVDIGH